MWFLFVLAVCVALSLQQSAIDIAFRHRKAFSIKREVQPSVKLMPGLPELGNDEKREAFRYEQTLVIRDSGKDDDVVHRCEVVRVGDETKRQSVYTHLSTLYQLEVQEVTIDKIFKLMEDCDSLDVKSSKPEKDEKKEVQNSGGKTAIIHGIYPGTKWCGPGNIASKYHDLGRFSRIDRCCRAHDFCPVKVRAKNEHYGLNNTGKYTKSHCLCDEAFHACLKKNKGFTSKIIGNIYFRTLLPNCIQGLPENANESMKWVKATRKW